MRNGGSMRLLEYTHFRLICQDNGLKSTSQRFVIYKTLLEMPSHPTADQLFDQVSTQLPGLGRDTVYRTLATLSARGLARKLVMPGGATHFDGNMTPHHHFLCEECGVIYDLEWPALAELPKPGEWDNIGRVRLVSALIAGCCRFCQTAAV